MLADLRFRVRALLRRSAMESELDAELRAHLAQLVRKHEQAGLPRAEAERRARLEFGSVESVKADCRDARGVTFVETLAQDLRYAFRILRKDAGVAAIVTLTLALAIGASTTVFSVVDAVLLKPLPYDQPERVVFPWRLPPPSVDVGFDVIPWGRRDFLAYAAQTRAFEHLGAFLGSSFNVTGRGEPARYEGARVSAGFFRVLGVAPRLGRTLSDAADRPGGAPEVVIGDALWRERFDADPAVLGRSLDLNGVPHTIVGVMPDGFTFPESAGLPGVFTLPRRAALWAPLALSRGPSVRGEPSELAVIGRLAAPFTPASLDRAQAELDVFARQMDVEVPQGKGWFQSRAVPMARQIGGETRRPLLLMLAAVGLLLLIACSNVANLLLTRSTRRSRELTLRAALGAGRARLVRQLATEHLLLAAVGGAAAVALAAVGVDLVRAFGPTTVPRLADARIDAMVLAFTAGLTLACGLAFGVAPAWFAARHDLVSALKDGGRAAGGANGSRSRHALIVVQVALALVLSIAGGLLARTFIRLMAVDAGFNPDRALTFELTLPPTSYAEPDRIVALYTAALERLRLLPDVQSAAIGETVPMGGAGESTGLRIPDRPAAAALLPPFANYTIVSPSYFSATGTALLRGRDFRDTDTADAPPVAIVNAAMARQYWPGQDAIGKQVGVPIHAFNMTVVGVVADVKHLSIRESPGPEIYVPYTQRPWPSMSTMHVVLRTKGDPASVTLAARSAIRSVDPELPIAAVATLDSIVQRAMAPPRFSMLLVAGFAALSLALACVGLYGAVSYAVASRTQEIGIRLALGATARRVSGLFVAQYVRITSAGAAIGVALALAFTRALAPLLYGVEAADPLTFVSLTLLLLLVALAAAYVPARRAMQVAPMVAMRAE